MKIKREGERRNSGGTTLLKESAISDLQVGDDQNFEIVFRNVNEGLSSYKYTITLTPDDVSKIMAEAMKQALTKNK